MLKVSGGVYPSCPNPDPDHAGQWEDGVSAPGKPLPLPPPVKSVGDPFYKQLRKLGCVKNAEGDYVLPTNERRNGGNGSE